MASTSPSAAHKQQQHGHASDSLGHVALKGALAAVVGGMALKMLWNAGQHMLPESEKYPLSPTREAVGIMASKRGVHLSSGETTMAAGAMYGGMMAGMGALYGIAEDRLRPPPYLAGLALAGLIYGANFTRIGALPKLGIIEPAGDQPKRQAAVPLAAHVGFGLATAAAYKAMS
ncbi:MAG: hypothetical protein ACR2GG_01675 [Gemmatimonadaceae bacterium]